MPERRPQPEAGIPAFFETDCQMCGEAIHLKDRICYRRGWAIHVRCVGGGDE